MNPEVNSQIFSTETEESQSGGGHSMHALQSALEELNQSIHRLEAIMTELESGRAEPQESVRLISEANELAVSSSQSLDRLIQDVAYGSGERGLSQDEERGRQQSLELS